MANIKSRVKAPKSASRIKVTLNTNNSLTVLKKSSDSTKKVSKRSAGPKQRGLTELQKVLMRNDHINYNELTEKTLKLKQLPKQNIPKPNLRERKPVRKISKPQVETTIPRFVTDSGRLIGPRTKENLKMIDLILKGELMIDTPSKKVEKTSVTAVGNNNEVGISDQNKNSSASVPAFRLPENENSIFESKTKKIEKRSSKNEVKPGVQTRSKPIVPDKPETKKKKLKSKTKLTKKEDTSPKPKSTKPKKKKSVEQTVKTKQVTLSNGLVLTLALFQCDHCQKVFSSKASVRRHIYTHLKIKTHCCKKCSKKFRYKMNLQNHTEKHHPDLTNVVPHVCQICDKEFLLQENLELHLSTHIKNENSFKCVYCNKQFSYHLLLAQHEKQHLLSGKYSCSVCQLSFDSINRLKFHMKSHLKIKDYICQHCGKEFLRMNSLRRHVQICHSGHRLQCPICKKKLKGHLTEHMRTHKKARPHECDHCGQRFTQSTQLRVHKRCHTGERPFHCRICSREFTHSNSLILHIRRHTGEKPFKCPVCPLTFSQLPHMKTHLIKIHKKDAPYKCHKCAECFRIKKDVENHVKNCTVGDRELTFEEKIQASLEYDEVQVETPMSISRMRYLLALLLTMVANKQRLKFLGS